MEQTALIVGAGRGISGAFARLLGQNGYRVVLASRSGATRAPELPEAVRIACDAAEAEEVERLF
ncbi:MAG TPA: SDR family NAD(P)-dependent oxidoreductase, partial [Burkholderiaceae bacterium]|nr:SDR family NAD(P)-dependent oxidoreductase [Burkholderiaceae bacterium]